MQTWLGTILFFIIVLSLWTGIHVYLYRRIVWTFNTGPGVRLALKIGLPFIGSLYFIGRVVQAKMDHDLGTIIIWPGAVYLALMALFLSQLLVYDIGFALPSWVLARRKIAGSLERVRRVGRWLMPLMAIVSVAACVHGTIEALDGPTVKRVEIRMRGLSPRLDGFRVLQISDLHVGGLVGRSYMDKVLDLAQPLESDLVLVTGDVSDERNGGDGTAIERIAAIPSRFGILSVTGNHEYYIGGDATVANYRRHGLPVLRQQHVMKAGGIVVAGVDDPIFLGGPTHSKEAVLKALKGIPDGLPVILMSHQPLAVQEAADAGVDLMLCGHTHGGQVPPFHLLTKLIYGYLTGRYQVGEMTLYVSNGAGFWGPATRVFADPEITLFTLKSM
ncbi:MAG: metallophosphoesterase [Deltaproteobacteria bacterium]|nr:metallophosphoesterase [Deltaproteobacteria bacterium]